MWNFVVVALCLVIAATAQPTPRPGFNMGLQHQGSDVVKNGVAAQEWLLHPPLHGFKFSYGKINFGLHISLDPTAIGPAPPEQDFEIILNNLSPNLFSLSTRGLKGNVKTSTAYMEARFEFICKAVGSAYASLEVRLPGYAQVNLYFEHECERPNYDLKQPVYSDNWNVVQNGQLIPTWNHVADSLEFSTEFAIAVPTGSENQYFRVEEEWDRQHMDVVALIHPADEPFAKPMSRRPTRIEVQYNCKDYTKEVITQVTMTLYTGWENPLIVAWTKVCGPPGGGPTGWSGGEIAGLTIGLVAVVAFIGGIAYNHYKHGKVGWDMVPGIDYARMLRDRLFDPPSYTPQTNYDNYDATNKEDTGYQNDL